MRKVAKKGKVKGFEGLYAFPTLGTVVLNVCMMCTNKVSSLNLELMISGNYVVIMIMLMYIYLYTCMYVCRCLIG